MHLPPLATDRPTRVLFVCLGNICRSPLAEGLFKRHVTQKGLEQGFVIDSAGTGGWHAGEAPHRGSRAVARRHGLDISDQQARQVRLADLEAFDLILAMDHRNLNDLQALQQARPAHAKIACLLDLAPVDHRRDVPDPYGQDDEAFEDVYRLLDLSTQQLLEEWVGLSAHR